MSLTVILGCTLSQMWHLLFVYLKQKNLTLSQFTDSPGDHTNIGHNLHNI